MKKRICGILLFCLLLVCFGGTALAAEKHPYYITVNLTENIVTVYEADETGAYTVPKQAFLCSSGESTPEGTFQTTQKYEWRPLFGDVWGQYATRITGHYLFHSVPYLEKDKSTLEYEEYNKLGTTASAGCIRLTARDAKWIYENCPIGTTVELFRGEREEPLQPTPTMQIDPKDKVRRGWDPTDPDPANPWKQGELREMTVEPSAWRRTVEAYAEENTYYLTAEDGRRLFARLGAVLLLPQETEATEEVTVFREKKEYRLSCRVWEGKAYYRVQDMAEMVGAELRWNEDMQKMYISHHGNTLTLSRRAA